MTALIGRRAVVAGFLVAPAIIRTPGLIMPAKSRIGLRSRAHGGGVIYLVERVRWARVDNALWPYDVRALVDVAAFSAP